MKILFIIILFIHGLIHLMGFLKAFGIMEISQLTQEISKLIGGLWLFVTLLYVIVIILFIFNKEWWWMPAIIATVISQFLIILSWQDTKFGTFPNIVILVVVIIGFAVWNFNMQTNKEINSLLSDEKYLEEIVTDEMLQNVPSAVQRWLNHIGMVGQSKIRNVHLKQKGLMKLEPDQKKWSPAIAEQYVTTEQPAFIWKVNMTMAPLIPVHGRDSFIDGEAEMQIKVATLFPVVNVTGNEKADESTLQRYLIELPFYPSAALSPYIKWEEIDEHSAKATMTYNGVSGSTVYHFNKQGGLEKVSALRYKDVGKNGERLECIGEVEEHTIIDGIKIPTKLNISWVLDEGIFTWYKIEIFDVDFNAE